ncbi:MAG: DUF2147 domain-containing protein [Pseudomonadales bacterium]|jgi:uncharacterized protein (DUF2147 family)|nr:DUF2147 domain-containing protein [Pseudomonadales bacterium]
MRKLLLLGVSLLAHAGASADITGCWISEAGDSVIELRERGGIVEGRVVGLERPVFLPEEARGTPGAPRTDLSNPEAALRARPIVGLAIVTDLAADGRRWTGGSVYDPESGNTYSARAELDGDGTLRLRGYVGSPLFGRTTAWTPAAARPMDVERMLEKARPFLPAGAARPEC